MKTSRKSLHISLLSSLGLAFIVSACVPVQHGQSQIKSRYGSQVMGYTSPPMLRSGCMQSQPCGYGTQLYRIDHVAHITPTVCCEAPQPLPQPHVVAAPEHVPTPPIYIEPPIYTPPPQAWPTPEAPVVPWLPTRK